MDMFSGFFCIKGRYLLVNKCDYILRRIFPDSPFDSIWRFYFHLFAAISPSLNQQEQTCSS